MMRILHMIGSLNIGGSQAMVMNLYRSMDRSQIQFDFIVDHPDQLYFADEIRALGGKIYTMPEFTGKNVMEVKKEWNTFFQTHPEYKVLHSHVRSYASLFLSIAKKYGVKTIIHSHSTSNGSGLKSVVKKVMQYPLRFQADYFFACSKESGKWLFGDSIVEKSNFHVVQNAIDAKKYTLKPDVRNTYRKELGLENKTAFIHVGRLHPAKNHDFLIQVFAAYVKKYPNTHLVLVGDGERRQELETMVSKLQLEDKVIFLGNRNDIAELLMAGDVFLFPSKWEGLPVTVVEAQASGLPCLVSNTVTKEVNISELVQYLPIDQGVQPWMEQLETMDFSRKNVLNQIKAANFDIEDTSKKIFKFYERLSKDE